MIFPDDEVARTFLEVLCLCLFFFLSYILGEYVWYKIFSSGIALSNKNKAGWVRSRQHDLPVLDIFPKTFASYIKRTSVGDRLFFIWDYCQLIRVDDCNEDVISLVECDHREVERFNVRIFTCQFDNNQILEPLPNLHCVSFKTNWDWSRYSHSEKCSMQCRSSHQSRASSW